MALEAAVERAVTECINEEILKEFLEKNRAEVIKVCLYEYNQEEHMKFVKEEGFRQGHEQGREQGEEYAKVLAIQNLMKNTGWNAKEAMKALGIPEEEREKYQSKLQEGQ